MAKAPAFQFYASDFLTGTMNFKAEEVGAYIRLLCYQWEHGVIKAEDIEPVSGVDMGRLGRVIQKFNYDEKAGTLQNARLEEVRTRQKEFSALQSERGKKGGRPKAGANPDESGNKSRNKTRKGKPFLEGEDSSLKSENSFEKSEKLLTDYDTWGQMITDRRDQGFEVELYNSGIDISEVTQDRMIKYIGLLNTYPKKRPETQQQFRKSFLGFLAQEIQDQKKHGNRSNSFKSKQQSVSEHNADQLRRVLDGTL